MKKMILALTFLISTSLSASNYMVINVTSIYDFNGVLNLMGLDGKSKGIIDCEKFKCGLIRQGLRKMFSTNNGDVSITLKENSNDKARILERYYFQDGTDCEEAIKSIKDNASYENPVSLVLDKSGINKVSISTNH